MENQKIDKNNNDILIDIDDISLTYVLTLDKIKQHSDIFAGKKGKHKTHTAIKKLSLQVKRGESLGIIGHNGAGKSTLLKILAGILDPTTGKVAINGKSMLWSLGIGFEMEASAKENVFLSGSFYGFTRAEMLERYDEIVKFAELEEFMDVQLKNFSSGMVSRLAFSICAMVKPEIMLIDEGFAVGDVGFNKKCAQKLEEMRKLGTTFIIVSHSLEMVRSMCKHTLWIEYGEVRGYGETERICNDYIEKSLPIIEAHRKEVLARQKQFDLQEDEVPFEKIDKTGTILKVENVTFHYRKLTDKIFSLKEYFIKLIKGKISHEKFKALDNINIEIEAGESVAVIGRNGAGKSTLLKALTGIIDPDEGNICTNGSVALLSIGAGFDNEATARENIFLSGALFGFSRKEITERLEKIVHFAELEDYVDVPIKYYSAGMVSRLAFAVAINVRPDIMLVDEVLSVGDERFEKKCKQKIEQLKERNTTFLLVSHSIGTVKSMCKRAIWIEKGKVVMQGDTESVCQAYLEHI